MAAVAVGAAPSGVQCELRSGQYRAVIASVGATLRSLTFEGRDLVVPFGEGEIRPAFRGVTVAPWPNRVVDGEYAYEGAAQRLPINERDRGHALHGLSCWLQFEQVGETTDHSVELEAIVEPQQGYPWRVRLAVRYELGAQGLTQTVTATNLSSAPAPYGVCPHPYLVAGPDSLDEWQLHLPASQVLTVTEDRLAPVALAEVSVDAERFDFLEARAIGDAMIDHAFTGLARDERGEARVEVRSFAGEGSGVALVWGASCEWLQIHTADLEGVPASENRLGLAVEPMTCAPDAFNPQRYSYDTGLVHLASGASHVADWRIEAL